MALTCVLFVLGYVSVYVSVSILLISGVYTVAGLSHQIQYYFSLFLGPILILVGMIHADLIRLNRFFKDHLIRWVAQKKWSGISAYPMGLLIALSFCPATAAIFFGMLIPLSISHGQTVLFPLIFALGASLPLIAISILITRGVMISGKSKIPQKLPVIGGWVLIVAGIYLSLQQIYIPYFA